MRVIKLLFILCLAVFGQDVLDTRKPGAVKATDYQMSQPFGQIASDNMPAWKVHADSGLVKHLKGIEAQLDSIRVGLSRADTSIFTIAQTLNPVLRMNLMPIDGQPFSHLGVPGYGFAYGNIERLESESSHHTGRTTLNAQDYPDLVALGKAITESADSLFYVYIPGGIWEMPAAPFAIYGAKDVIVEFAPNAILCPTPDWPSVVFEVTIASDIPEGGTTVTFSTGDGDFSKIKAGMAFMPRSQGAGAGSITTGVWQEDHYIITDINTGTGVATFWPPFDGDPQAGSVGFTQSFGYSVNPYAPRPADIADTLYSGGTVEFGGSSLYLVARGARVYGTAGVFTARPWGQSILKPVGSGGRAPVNSISSNGISHRFGIVVDVLHDGMIFQNSDAFIEFDNNVFLYVRGSAIHIGGRGRQTNINNNIAYKCGTGIYSSLDLQNVFVTNNLFIKNQSTTEHVYANYGSLNGLIGDHKTVVSHNYFDGGLGAIDVGHQSGRLDFSHNIVVNMIADGIAVGAGTDPAYDETKKTFMVDITYNQVAFCGRNGIFIDNLEGGRIIGNTAYNNGTNTGYPANQRSGFRIESDSTESVIISSNFAFNLPDSGSLSDAVFNMAEVIPKTQQYGFYSNSTDETNLYRDNTAWLNQTAQFSLSTGLPSGSEFQHGSVPWQPGTTRFRSSDNTTHVWTGSAWVQL